MEEKENIENKIEPSETVPSQPAAVENVPEQPVGEKAAKKENIPETVAPEPAVPEVVPSETTVSEVPPSESEAPSIPEVPSVPEPSLVEETIPASEEKEDVVPRVVREAPKGERRWYVIQAMTGHEDRVKKAIELTIESENLKDRVFQVLVPVEETVEIKGGKRVEKVRKMFPGYVFLEMILDEVSWYLIRQTQGVARFIGTKVQPTPVSDKEMQRVLKQLGKEERLEVSFEKGEGVRIISGAFRGYTGTVDEVSEGKGKLKVLINIFGRDTPVEVNFEHAQKIV